MSDKRNRKKREVNPKEQRRKRLIAQMKVNMPHEVRPYNGNRFGVMVRCGICGQWIERDEDFTLDHIKPKSMGGPNDLDNLQLTHLACNGIRGTVGLQRIKLVKRLQRHCIEIAEVKIRDAFTDIYVKLSKRLFELENGIGVQNENA